MNRNTKICIFSRVTAGISEITYHNRLNMFFACVAKVDKFNHTKNTDIRIMQ